ncbi:hypothetical protein KBX71_15085 [Micromonospora sp. D93]|uniref:hypothetical protein n=1 Tax=Micromonospora sp. D93 TaxID=2824886 RepID=UPI001B37FE23|nr:hypothetical protein [Micromonospora sp. D93]MBQ1019180.1 hypothetical protein [Micromonospora sp. D93]
MSMPSRTLDALMLDYSEARDDERSFAAVQGSVVALALTGVALLGALANEVADGKRVPPPLVAGAPLIILCILAYGQAMGALAVLRSFYLRSLEREIRGQLELRDLAGYPALQPLSYAELTVSYTTLARGRGFGRFMALMIFVSLWLVFGGLTLFLALWLTPPWQIAMAVVYGGGALTIFTDTVQTNMRGRSFFHRQVALTSRRQSGSMLPSGSPTPALSKKLLRYLVLPRPDDLVKALFVVAGIAVALTVGRDGRPAPTAGALVLFVIAVEWLVYQSRYQWNDIRGIAEDAQAPSSAQRGRLPGGAASVPASLLTMLLRMIAMSWVVALGWPGEPRVSRADLVLLIAVPLIYGVGIAYETIRHTARLAKDSRWSNLLLTLGVVGIGYPVRFALGWWAAGGPTWNLSLGWLLVACWGLGLLFVSLTWILEFADHINSYVDGDRSAYRVSPTILSKPHLLRLATLCGIRSETSDLTGSDPVDGGDLRIISRTRFRPWCPWRFGGAVWYIAVSLSLSDLLDAAELRLWPWGLAAAVMLALPINRRGGLLSNLAASLVLTTGVVWSLWITAPTGGLADRPAAVVTLFVVALLPSVLYLNFYFSTYRSTRAVAERVILTAVGVLRWLALWFVGAPRRATAPSMDVRTDPKPSTPTTPPDSGSAAGAMADTAAPADDQPVGDAVPVPRQAGNQSLD